MYNISIAAKLSGVPEIRIRTWESRYSVITPERSSSNQRIYSETDVEKLKLLNTLTTTGYRIGNLVNLSSDELLALVAKPLLNDIVPGNNQANVLTEKHQQIIDESITAISIYDDRKLYALLSNASVDYSQQELIENIVVPLIEKIGELWMEGKLRVSHEHFSSAVIRKLMANLSDGYAIPDTAPNIIIVTPEGQYHELGAVIAAAHASSCGWRTTFLGVSLSAEEICNVAQLIRSKVVLLSIVYPNDDASLNSQLVRLRELSGKGIHIIAAGNAVDGYLPALKKISAHISTSPGHFITILESIRKKINPNNA